MTAKRLNSRLPRDQRACRPPTSSPSNPLRKITIESGALRCAALFFLRSRFPPAHLRKPKVARWVWCVNNAVVVCATLTWPGYCPSPNHQVTMDLVETSVHLQLGATGYDEIQSRRT